MTVVSVMFIWPVVFVIKPRDSFGIAKDSTPPATLHYDMWLGPVPSVRIMKKGVIITGIGFGIPEMEIPETRDLISLILPAGD